jgi:hypothetical protein
MTCAAHILRWARIGRLGVIAVVLTFCQQLEAQQLPPLSYHHVDNGRADPETKQRTFAACKVQADIAAPMIEGSWDSLTRWQLARDDCMRTQGWVRD